MTVLRKTLGVIGIAVSAPFFVWLALGWIEGVPSMQEVFGLTGMRTPASITVAGLLLAALAFWDV